MTKPRRPSPFLPTVLTEPKVSAHVVHLRYVEDGIPGVRRIRHGKKFQYKNPQGNILRDAAVLKRIASLVIPPAWEDVWICPFENGHLQATGRDARGRKQYRYHPKWRHVRDLTKYYRMIPFAEALPRIRERVSKDLSGPALTWEKVLATVVRLLEETLIRVGNEEYAKENHSYGLTTMHDSHVSVHGSTLQFHFRGKSGKVHTISVKDPRMAKIVRACRDLPGQEIFQYLDESGARCDVKSDDVNAYLKEISGEDFTAKDFRTWAGTVQAALQLELCGAGTSERQRKSNIVQAIEVVSEKLGNTPAVCRKCYVHPVILECYLENDFLERLERFLKRGKSHPVKGLMVGEAAVLSFLKDNFEKRS